MLCSAVTPSACYPTRDERHQAQAPHDAHPGAPHDACCAGAGCSPVPGVPDSRLAWETVTLPLSPRTGAAMVQPAGAHGLTRGVVGDFVRDDAARGMARSASGRGQGRRHVVSIHDWTRRATLADRQRSPHRSDHHLGWLRPGGPRGEPQG